MEYLEEALGISVSAAAWNRASSLPYYLRDMYDFSIVALDSSHCLFIRPKAELGSLPGIKKHIEWVHGAAGIPIVLELDSISARRRKALISSRIPFVVRDSQIYLPFLGIALQEKYYLQAAPKDVLMPSSQLLLFYYLYEGQESLYTGGLAERFGISAMQITRATRQLADLGLVTESKDGVKKVISSTASRRELYEAAEPHLIDPVKRMVYVEEADLPSALPLSGISALSAYSMLSPPLLKTVAFHGKTNEVAGESELTDHTAQVEVEVWHYDPELLSPRKGLADPLSIVISLKGESDDRTLQATDGLLASILEGETNGQRY